MIFRSHEIEKHLYYVHKSVVRDVRHTFIEIELALTMLWTWKC